MNENDKLPNYYDVLIEGFEIMPKSTHDECRNFTLFVKDVEAADPQTAVRRVLNDRWAGMCEISEGEHSGWIVTNQDDETRLQLEVDDYANCATAVPYERRLRLAGAQPLLTGGE